MDSNRFIRPIPSAHWIDFCTHPRCFLRIHRVFVDWNRCFIPPKTTRAPHFNTGVSDGFGGIGKTHNDGQHRGGYKHSTLLKGKHVDGLPPWHHGTEYCG